MEWFIAFKTPGSLFHVVVVATLFLATVESLECYQCSNSDEDSCTGSTTCASGEVCSNKVFQRYTLTTVYDKDCMSKSSCYALEDLNTDRYCSTTPSTCTYCCRSNLCNAAISRFFYKTHCYWIVLISLVLNYFMTGKS